MNVNNPIPFPDWLGQMIASQQSSQAAGQNAFNQGFFPGANKGLDALSASMAQKLRNQKQQQLMDQLLGNMPQPQQQQQPGHPGEPPVNPIDRAKLLGIYMKINPQGAQELIGKMIQQQAGINGLNPLQESEMVKNYAMAEKYKNTLSGKPTASIWRNSVTGQMTDDPAAAQGPEWKEYKTSQGDVLNRLAGQGSANARNDAMNKRTEAWNRSIDNRQINQLVKNIGITPKQQSALQQNNLRADRAIQLLSKPSITWQELALGEIDLAGIMQGGVPHVDEVKNTHFPGWQEQWARWQTYATGHPTENVPDPIKQKVLNLVTDVIQIDNKFLEANRNFNQRMIGPTIRGGTKQFDPAIKEMTDTLTSKDQRPNKNQDSWSIERLP